MTNNRPSHKELTGKLRAALSALEADNYAPVDPTKLADNYYKLRLFTASEQKDALRAALSEIDSADYDGSRPPQKSYERGPVEDEELFAFSWDSLYFKRRMYLKFCLVGDGHQAALYIVSLHKVRFQRRKP